MKYSLTGVNDISANSGITEKGRQPNRLIKEKSPYLLQHAYNPVDWYPWGDEAFEKARVENKPVFLSIGYSTCHWCHVMEKESFNDPEVAKLMNETIISIKVDREERPDIDSVYMSVCQIMTGSGGWPLSIFITPGKKPIFAATYIPKHSRFGRTGMLDLIPAIKDMWNKRRNEVEKQSEQMISALKDDFHPPVNELNEDVLHDAFSQLSGMFDEEHGGFGDSPKFPTPHSHGFLLRYWKRTGDERALYMVEKTLSGMRNGGIYDHIGFGFHRYSTDSLWLVPHFEKMLYDQALLVMAYIEAYQATGKTEYEQTAREIFSYVLRDMTAREGGFYSAEDADSEGIEGKFYVWTEDEIQHVLSSDEFLFVKTVFNVEKDGNFRDEVSVKNEGKNILHLKQPVSAISAGLNMEQEKLQEQLESARQKLFAAREKRVRPDKDDKILTDWNGLMIAALAKGARVFGEVEYEKAAKYAAAFILMKMRDTGKLYHRYRDGDVAIPAFLDDYAFLIHGLLELYETTFDSDYLKTAISLTDELIGHFWDEKNGGFYLTSDEAEELLLIRKKEIYDGALPSGNSVGMLDLLRLARMTANTDYEIKAMELGKAFSGTVTRSPAAYTMLMQALDFAIGPDSEVVIIGDREAEDTKAMFETLGKEFLPNKVVIFRPAKEEHSEIMSLAPYTRDMSDKNGKVTAYVCRNYSCELPTTEKERMLELLRLA